MSSGADPKAEDNHCGSSPVYFALKIDTLFHSTKLGFNCITKLSNNICIQTLKPYILNKG